MELIACRCEVGFGLPHDHYVGGHELIEGVHHSRVDPTDVGHLWVDWRAFAKELMRADADAVPIS